MNIPARSCRRHRRLTGRLRLTLGLRGDVYGYDVDARTLPVNSGKDRMRCSAQGRAGLARGGPSRILRQLWRELPFQ
jgi:hypothetical protein